MQLHLFVNQFPFRDVYFFISILHPEQPCGSCRPQVFSHKLGVQKLGN